MNRRGEAGSAVLEAVIAAPVILLLVVFVIAAGRVADAHQLVDDAAGDAARAASTAASRSQAQSAASQAAGVSLTDRGLSCTRRTVTVDLANWQPGGTVGVTVTCTAQLTDLGPIPLAGNRTVTAHAASVIDPYRQLQP